MLARERQPSQAQQRGAGRAEPRATGRGEGPLDPYRPSMYFYCGNEHAVVDAALRVLDERVLTPVRRAAGTEGARTEEVLAVFLDASRDVWQDQGQLLVAACEFVGEDDETRDDWRAASVALGDALAPVVLRDRERGALRRRATRTRWWSPCGGRWSAPTTWRTTPGPCRRKSPGPPPCSAC
ncbi:hypothetical protein ACFQVA_39735 [Actinomadura keratinilytica]